MHIRPLDAWLTACHQLHLGRHPRLVPPTACKDNSATLVARSEPALRSTGLRVRDSKHRQHPDTARKHPGHGLLPRHWTLPMCSRPAGDRADWGAVDVLLLHVRISINT